MAQQTFAEDKQQAVSVVRDLVLSRKVRAEWIAFVLLIALSGSLFLEHLGSLNITMYDEVIHANVVRNLAEHCCVPRLHRSDLGTDWRDWTNNSVWLHKPLLPFFITATGYKILGGSLWALRLPGALFGLSTAALVFYIGRRFFNYSTGLTGLAIFTLSPFTNSLVHGRIFSGFPDLTFVFFDTIALYLILQWGHSRSRSTLRWLGLVLGLAYLCKGGLSLAPFVVLTIVAIEAGGLRELPGVLQSVLMFVIVVLPEKVYWMVHHPVEYSYEQNRQLLHLFANIEGLGAPWHAYFTRSLPEILGPHLIPFVYFAIAWALLRHRRGTSRYILALWVLTYLIPLSFAVSKTPNFIFAVLPAIALLLPNVVGDLIHNHQFRLVLLLSALSLTAPILWRIFVKPGFSTGDAFWSHNFGHSSWLTLLIFTAISIIAVAFLWSMYSPSKSTAATCLVLTSVMLFVVYVRRDYLENREEVTECNGALTFAEQLQLREAGYSLRPIVDQDSLIMMTQDRDLQYLYVMYWSGADAMDVCRRMPELTRFQGRPKVFLLTEGSLPAAAIARLPLGNLYSLEQIPFSLWDAEIRRACQAAQATSRLTIHPNQLGTLPERGTSGATGSQTEQSMQIILTSSPNPSRVNQPVTFTAAVAPLDGALPTGSITFAISGIKPLVAPLNNGRAAVNWTFLYTGERTVTATYRGGANDRTAVSQRFIQKVNY